MITIATFLSVAFSFRFYATFDTVLRSSGRKRNINFLLTATVQCMYMYVCSTCYVVSGWSCSWWYEPSSFHVRLLICVVLSQLMQDGYGETALFAACRQGRYDPAALLIDQGADVNYLSKVRPLYMYVHGGRGRVVCSV